VRAFSSCNTYPAFSYFSGPSIPCRVSVACLNANKIPQSRDAIGPLSALNFGRIPEATIGKLRNRYVLLTQPLPHCPLAPQIQCYAARTYELHKLEINGSSATSSTLSLSSPPHHPPWLHYPPSIPPTLTPPPPSGLPPSDLHLQSRYYLQKPAFIMTWRLMASTNFSTWATGNFSLFHWSSDLFQ
jgi:hypothetical protein